MRRILGLAVAAFLVPLAVPASADGEKLRDYLEGTCGLAGAGKGTAEHEECIAEERESYEASVAGMREDFETACAEEGVGDDEAMQACLREHGRAKAAQFEEHIAAIREDSRVRDVPELHDRLSELCSLVMQQEPGSPSHDYCIAQHAIQYGYFAEAVVEELNANPALEGF